MSEQLTELPAVARNINMPCKKCGVDRYFVVVAHTSATAAKCKCEVCGATKTFKLTKPKAAKKPGVKRVSKSREPDHAAIWNDLKSQIGDDNVVAYSMKSKFSLANAIQHPKFGVGFVTNATNEKVDVAFQDGTRALVHNRS
jgi:uncharacterized Zn finger protein